MDEEPEFDWEVVLEGSDGAASGHELIEIWKDIFRPNLAVFAHGLVSFLTNRLRQVRLLFRSVGRAYPGWDPFSIRHQTIEHGDESFWDFGVIIDAARDVLAWLLSSDLNRAEQVIQEWISSDVPLLKRLGVYGLVKHPSFNADKKLNWILNANLIYAVSPDSEVTQLLESQYPEASNAVRQRVVAMLRQTPAELGDTQGALLSYAVLTKLSHRLPSCPILQREINDILEKHPEFRSAPEEHGIPQEWFSPGGAVAISQPSEVERLLTKSPEQDLEELLAYVGER
jgi:hypothetical protein